MGVRRRLALVLALHRTISLLALQRLVLLLPRRKVSIATLLAMMTLVPPLMLRLVSWPHQVNPPFQRHRPVLAFLRAFHFLNPSPKVTHPLHRNLSQVFQTQRASRRSSNPSTSYRGHLRTHLAPGPVVPCRRVSPHLEFGARSREVRAIMLVVDLIPSVHERVEVVYLLFLPLLLIERGAGIPVRLLSAFSRAGRAVC